MQPEGRGEDWSDIEPRQYSLQRARQPPNPVAYQEHQGRQQDDADDGGVENDGHGETDADLAYSGDRRAGKGDEDGHHDDRGARDHTRRLLQAKFNRLRVIAELVVVLAHAHEQEDRVIDREPEDDTE